jgi:ketosteroid isomerase-like protein
MDKNEMTRMAEQFLETWNTQDVEKVTACYAADVHYLDPNTKGVVHGADAMRRYLTKLLAAWDMHYALKEAVPFKDAEGGAVLWHAVLRKAGGDKSVEVDGMDLVIFENGLIKRNEVYFDRAALASLA